MARSEKVAIRYAKALFDSIGDRNKAMNIVKELETFANQVESHDELKFALSAPLFVASQRRELIEDLVSKMKLSDFARKVLLVFSAMKRLDYTAAIAEKLKLLLLEASGVALIKIETASSLSDSELKKLSTKFKDLLGKDVEASLEVNPALMGGLRVAAGGRIYDGTLSTELATLKEQLVGGA